VTQSMGMNVLAGPETGGFRDNVTVVAQPNLEGLDIAAFKQQHLDTMGSLDDVTLDETKIIERDGQPMLLLEYHGRPPTSDVDLHFTSLLALQGGRYVVVTATVLEDRWEEVGPTADWMLAGLAIRP